VGIVQPLLEVVFIFAQRCRGELRGHARLFQARIRSHKTDFIQAHTFCSDEVGLQLLSEFCGLGLPGRKGTNESGKLLARDTRKELNAGQARGGKQLGEQFFSGSALKGHTIKQKL
jgi:hypothetical protein